MARQRTDLKPGDVEKLAMANITEAEAATLDPNDRDNFNVGVRLSNKASISAAQMGMEATIKAANPESTRCSAHVTNPFPPVHINNPETINTGNSSRDGRILFPFTNPQSRSIPPATNERVIAIVKDGKPDPSRTAKRIARYVLLHMM